VQRRLSPPAKEQHAPIDHRCFALASHRRRIDLRYMVLDIQECHIGGGTGTIPHVPEKFVCPQGLVLTSSVARTLG
jgi:hypothetical protein